MRSCPEMDGSFFYIAEGYLLEIARENIFGLKVILHNGTMTAMKQASCNQHNRSKRKRSLFRALASLAALVFALLPLNASLAQTQEEAQDETQTIVIVMVELEESEPTQSYEDIPLTQEETPAEETQPELTPIIEISLADDAAEQDATQQETQDSAQLPTQQQAQSDTQTTIVANEYLFYALDAEAAAALCGQYGGALLRWSDGLGVMYREAFEHLDGIFYQQELYLIASAPYYAQPGETRTNIASAQGMSASQGAGVVIAVIDSGIDLDHPALIGNIAGAVSVVPESAYGDGGYFDPDYQGAQDYEGHGSHIAGILVGQTEEMTLGIAPNAQVLSIKALEKYGFSAAGTTEWMIRAILYAISAQADVINLSLGGGKSFVSAAQVALRQAADAGILVVTATGNSYAGPAEGIDYPAAYENTLAVTSVTVEGKRVTLSDFSRYGAGTDLSAPGVAIYSCNAEGLYEVRSGTSMSCAIVSGIAALLLSENPSLTPTELTWLLKQSAHDAGTVGYDTVFGWGVVDAAAALRLLQSGKATTQAVEPPEIPVALPEKGVPADQDWLQTQTGENRTQVQPEHSAQISPETGRISPVLFALAGFAIVACGVFFLHRNSAKKTSAS